MKNRHTRILDITVVDAGKGNIAVKIIRVRHPNNLSLIGQTSVYSLKANKFHITSVRPGTGQTDKSAVIFEVTENSHKKNPLIAGKTYTAMAQIDIHIDGIGVKFLKLADTESYDIAYSDFVKHHNNSAGAIQMRKVPNVVLTFSFLWGLFGFSIVKRTGQQRTLQLESHSLRSLSKIKKITPAADSDVSTVVDN